MLRNRVASPIILGISFMLTFPVTTSGYISSPEFASVPRESAKEIVISFLDCLNSLLPVIRQLTMGLPILFICRCVYNGSAYDVCDNTAIDKTVETLAD